MKELKPILNAISDIAHDMELRASENIHRSSENRIENITKIHTDKIDPIDWKAIAAKPMPERPRPLRANYDKALLKFKKFQPRFYHLPGQYSRKKKKLRDAGKRAIESDKRIYSENKEIYEQQHAEWSSQVSAAQSVLSLSSEAIMGVLQSRVPSIMQTRFIGLIGNANCKVTGDIAYVNTEVFEFDMVVPKTLTRLLKSGRLSERAMPIRQGNDLYRDYVASAALKIAGDIFALVPLRKTVVTCSARMVNKANGHEELTPVLSVLVDRESYTLLNLEYIDPSDCIGNFKHSINYKANKGMSPISELCEA